MLCQPCAKTQCSAVDKRSMRMHSLPSLQKEVMFLVALVCLSVCLLNWDEILWRGPGKCNEELIKFWW